MKTNDTTKIEALFLEWEKSNPNDPQLFISAVGFYLSNSRPKTVSLAMGYNTEKLRKAIRYANTGIDKFPDRLDIRYSKCRLLHEIGDYENFTKELIKTVEYSRVNKNNWLWTDNKKQEDGEHFLLGIIQSFLTELYDTKDDNIAPTMIKIGEATLKYYRNNIGILSMTSIALMATKNYDRAIDYLKQAEKIDPQNQDVLNILAEGYKLKGDKANAIKYFELIAKYGDEEAKQQAKQNIGELKQ